MAFYYAKSPLKAFKGDFVSVLRYELNRPLHLFFKLLNPFCWGYAKLFLKCFGEIGGRVESDDEANFIDYQNMRSW